MIAGEYQGRQGAFTGKFIQATYLDVTLQAGQAWSLDSDPDQTLFVYLFSGRASFDPNDPGQIVDEKQPCSSTRASVSGSGPLARICVSFSCRLRLCTNRSPGRPIVMNTKAELDQAFRDLDNGTFLKQG